MLEPEHLGLAINPGGHTNFSMPADAGTGAATSVGDSGSGKFPTLSELEKQHIFAALDHCKGNRTHAAKILDVSIRTLRNKLHEYNVAAPEESASSES